MEKAGFCLRKTAWLQDRNGLWKRPCTGQSEPDATLTTFDLERVEVILSAPLRFMDIDTLNTPISLMGFFSGASANFTSLFSLDHPSSDVSEN